jgi:hypothetical protein
MNTERRVRPLGEVSADLLREATDAVKGLIDHRLPLQFDKDEFWGPTAHGFLARGGTLLDSLTLLVEHDQPGEAVILLRVLFEHVTTFCWLAINPEAHLALWTEWTNSRRLKLHNEAGRFGVKVLTPREVKESRSAKPPLPLPQLAQKVDEYWSQTSSAFRPFNAESPHILSFTGFYTAVYRTGSNLVHADLFSVDRFATMPLRRQATIHPREARPNERGDDLGLAVPFMGFLLIAFGHRFSWPTRAEVDQITDKIFYYD